MKWVRKAAEQNRPEAQYMLGLSYAKGQGVAKDEIETVKWFRKAAEQNNAGAQYNLGRCYGLGQGVAKDYVESYKWALLAAGQGDKNAKELATILENNASRAQIEEGRKRASDFKPAKMQSVRDFPDRQ
jgi:hypothetical protein